MGDEHPDWLPEGWEVRVKVRIYGRRDKSYVNKSNGLKFHSKPEVLRYLESSSKRKERKKIEITRTAAENLPPGWIKEIRAKKKGRKIRKDPYYIDPVSGLHFRSVPEVLRYLESKDSGKVEAKPDDKDQTEADLKDHSQSSSTEAERQRLINKKTVKKPIKKKSDNADDSRMEHRKEGDDSLPIELSDKLQTVNNAEQHADRMKDNEEVTTRRLRSGTKVAAMRKVNVPEANHVQHCDSNNDSMATDPPNMRPKVNRKEQQGGENQNKSVANSKQGSNVTVTKVPAMRKVNVPEANHVLHRDNNNGSVAADPPKMRPKVNRKEQRKGGENQNTSLANSKQGNNVTGEESLKSGSKDAAAENSSKQREEGNNTANQQHENVACVKKRKQSTSALPRRTSRRHAHAEIETSIDAKPGNEVGAASELSGKAEVNTPQNNGGDRLSNDLKIDTTGKFGTFNEPSENSTKLRTEIVIGDKQKEPAILPLQDISRVQEHKVVDVKEEVKHEKHLDSSFEDLLMDPCIEFAIKTLTGAIPIEDVSRISEGPVSSLTAPNQPSSSSTVMSSDDIWSDPCFEFAVKTLTSDIPMENGSNLQLPLSPPEASGSKSLTTPMFGFANSYPLASLNHFGAETKGYPVQQNVRDPPVPHSVKDSSQNLYRFQPSSQRR